MKMKILNFLPKIAETYWEVNCKKLNSKVLFSPTIKFCIYGFIFTKDLFNRIAYSTREIVFLDFQGFMN